MAYIIFVNKVSIAMNRTNTACAMIDSFFVTKEGLWFGKSNSLSNIAESEKVSMGVGCCG